MATQPVIALEGVRFAYAGSPFRLNVASLRIEPGEKVACIGASGSGKTTLLHIAAGVLQPERGRVELLGREVSAMSDRQRRLLRFREVGMVFQEFELLEYLTAEQNILLNRVLGGGVGRDENAAARVRDLARAAGIEHVLGRKPRKLSQGERQRVAMCRALLEEPRVVLCDEPTGNLDPWATEGVLRLLFERAERSGACVVMVTHNHALLDRFDRVVDMRELVDAGRSA